MAEVIEQKPVKPGYKTSEFWLATGAMVLSAAFASGLVETGTMYDQVLGMFAMVLTSMGYSVSRGKAKK